MSFPSGSRNLILSGGRGSVPITGRNKLTCLGVPGRAQIIYDRFNPILRYGTNYSFIPVGDGMQSSREVS